ncbi:EST1 DNA bind domain containing protein [Pyrenophora tritici-repentis]|uniref:EST1-DNA-bind domain containing protein n=1 Tax=Pyrenophora tritici-repentis TaxID=45151 RepID=A0A922N7Z7_9PLEO|nr:EST1-DNA-bind domain containing protein [Pyrenophora tritici-repentis]KAI2488174.1 EST1 DNA bind domain containing protein [Pyrenophora tritici-repentis]PZD24553.1 EST1-DNA-bind domain containing protein [Pyrenophora tritici-repentis]
MNSGDLLQSRFAQALKNQQGQGPHPCPYPGHGGRMFQDFQQFLDHARIEHRSDFEGLDTRQSRAKLRELSIRFRRSDHSSVATAGDRSAPDIGGLTLESEKEPRRTSPTSGRKRSAPTEHEFTGRKGKAPTHVEVVDSDYSRHIPHTVVPDRLKTPKSQDPRLFDPKLSPRGTSSPHPTTPEPSSAWSTDVTKSSKLPSPQPQSSERQQQQTTSKPQQSQRQPGVLHLPRTDPRYPNLILQPDSRPISQEELASEVKSIYAGLIMVENKCMHVDRAQAAAAAQEGEAKTNLASDHWQALIALHRTLLHEHHDFFLASQHPSSSPALRRLAGKYSMPARMWKHGIHSFLELLRRRLPESIDHMLAFIYLAYQMVALLYETVPAFEDTWIECLGDLGRYRMAIEDEDVRDRETWAGVARSWYIKAADKNPTVGRLYHHLAILARPHPLLQMYYYSRSLASVKPFENARDSIKTLLDPLVEKAKHTSLEDLSNEEVFIFAHARQFDDSSIETDSFGTQKPTAEFLRAKVVFMKKLDIHIGRVTAKWKDLGVYVAVTNIAGWFNYGKDKNLIRHAFVRQYYPQTAEMSPGNAVTAETKQKAATTSDQQKEEEKEEKEGEEKLPETAKEWKKALIRIGNNCHFRNAKALTNEASALVLRRLGDKNVLPHVHVMLAFLSNIASSTYVSSLIADAPWTELVAFLNALIKNETRHSQSQNQKLDINTLLATDLFPSEGERTGELPLPEDYHIRGQMWAQHFPEKWFEREHDEEERYLELASTAKYRVERILRFAFSIVKVRP